ARQTAMPCAQTERRRWAYFRPQRLAGGERLATAEKPAIPGKQDKPEPETKGGEISFGEFDEVEDASARSWAHLGELFRERGRFVAAAEEYGKAHALVGSAYESVSNKYALALMAVRRLDDAEKGLRSSLDAPPGT